MSLEPLLARTPRPLAAHITLVHVPAPRVPLEAFLSMPLQDARTASGFMWDARTHESAAREEWAFAGRGVQHRIEVSGAEPSVDARVALTQFFRELDESRDDEGAPPARMFGGLAFRGGDTRDETWAGFADATFVLPRLRYALGPDRAVLTLAVPVGESVATATEHARRVAGALAAHAALPPAARGAKAPARITRETSLASWSEQVEAALTAIRRGEADKLVTARRTELTLPGPGDVPAMLAALAALEPSAVRFAFQPRHEASFFGASPELLARVHEGGQFVDSEAVAGSVPRAGDDAREAAALAASEKDAREHAHVITGIVDALAPLAAHVDAGATSVRTLAAVHHLRTPVRATLRDRTHVLDVVRALHPTPAVSGAPRAAAGAWLAANERVARGWYAAPVGFVDRQGEGAFVVAIRSALVRGARAWVYAGAGIVEGSVAEAEYRETRAKMRTLLTVLGAP